MVADPTEIGYTPIALPGYTVDSLLGKGAFATVYKAIQTEASASSPPTKMIDMRPPQLPASLAVHRVRGDGNCFFHVIADQLRRLGVRDAGGSLFTHEALRKLTLSHVTTEPHLRALLTDEDVLDLARLNGFVDHGAVAAMADAIDQDIVLYQPTGVLRFDTSGHAHFDHRDDVSMPAVRVVYNGHDHYDSVIPVAEGASSSIQLPREAAEMYTDVSRPRKKAKTEPRAVVVKVYPQDHRAMQREILCSLAPHRHIPVVVDSCDVKGEPALLATPVGRPVWPVKDGVHARVPDYLKLLAVLQHAHGRGICHRDVKPQNIFIDDEGNVIFSDWGSAAMTGELTTWAGTKYFYTPQDEHWPSPAEDLVAYVLTIFVLDTGVAPSEARRCVACSAFWQEALRLANQCNYDALRIHINSR